jgi:hypothetical protein
MFFKFISWQILSILGIVSSILCLGLATTYLPGGFDWNRDFVSTMLRGPAGPSRSLADAGVVLFCLSTSAIFIRLARLAIFAREAKTIRIAGIASAVYSALTITPMHDLMVSISLVFGLIASVALVIGLGRGGENRFFAGGCLCLAVMVASAMLLRKRLRSGAALGAEGLVWSTGDLAGGDGRSLFESRENFRKHIDWRLLYVLGCRHGTFVKGARLGGLGDERSV